MSRTGHDAKGQVQGVLGAERDLDPVCRHSGVSVPVGDELGQACWRPVVVGAGITGRRDGRLAAPWLEGSTNVAALEFVGATG